MRYLLSIITLLMVPTMVLAAPDLSISQDDIRFSSDALVAGDTVRVYASIHNNGDVDVSGYVNFYLGAAVIGQSQVISVLANGNAEEVYMDFVTPPSDFNLMAKIEGTDPTDANLDNNFAITTKIFPIEDDDRDGIDDEVDNCPSAENNNQRDIDNDGLGDVCDPDDDNDGLSDEVEAELGSNPASEDTDGDSVLDSDDAYPTDPTLHELQVVKLQLPELTIPAVTQETAADSTAFSEIIENLAMELKNSGADEAASNSVSGSALTPTDSAANDEQGDTDEDDSSLPLSSNNFGGSDLLRISSNAVFTYERIDWNTYTFTILAPDDTASTYQWDFGDGVTSSKPSVTHTFSSTGLFDISLAVQGEDGIVAEETSSVLVPFFTLKNPVVTVAVSFLAMLMFMLGAMLITSHKAPKI